MEAAGDGGLLKAMFKRRMSMCLAVEQPPRADVVPIFLGSRE